MFIIFKRIFDIIFSIIILTIFCPLIIFSSCLILIFDFNNPFFIHERSGLNGRKIKIIKLRTMKDIGKFYKKQHQPRILIKPGLTGLAQIKLRDSTNWSKKFNYDSIYVKKANYNLDLYILFKTFSIIFNSIFKKNHRAIESIDYKRSFFENYCK